MFSLHFLRINSFLLADVLVPTCPLSINLTMPRCIHIPDIRLIFDESIHQILAFLVFKDYNFNTSLLQVGFTAKEGLVLPNYNT
jgi:hypothetical protein